MSSGQKVYFTKSAKERRFGLREVLVYGKIAMPFQYTLTICPETLQEGKSFLLSFEGKVVDEQDLQHQHSGQSIQGNAAKYGRGRRTVFRPNEY